MKSTINNVAYWRYHSQTKPACILIHGFTGSHEGFQYIIPELERFHIIVPDLPGFGESSLDIDNYTIDALARRVNSFVEDLNLKELPYVIGHSMGGLVVASMLAQAPNLYNKQAVLVSPVATKVTYLDSRKIGEFLGRLQFYLGKTIPGAGHRLVKSRLISRVSTAIILTADQPKLKQQIREHHFKNLDYISSIEFYYQLHIDINKKGSIDYASELNKHVSLMIISGDKDNVTPIATQRRLVAALQGGKLHVIHGVGHLLHYERPREVAAAIDGFLP
jgi:pimeloyl-ACP methyl ester carboxylesterase